MQIPNCVVGVGVNLKRKMEFKRLDVERLDQDIEYRYEMISYLMQELAEMQKFHDHLSQEGNILGEILLNKISNIKADLQFLQANINDGLA